MSSDLAQSSLGPSAQPQHCVLPPFPSSSSSTLMTIISGIFPQMMKHLWEGERENVKNILNTRVCVFVLLSTKSTP